MEIKEGYFRWGMLKQVVSSRKLYENKNIEHKTEGLIGTDSFPPLGREEGMRPREQGERPDSSVHEGRQNRKLVSWTANMGPGTFPKMNLIW